MSTATKPAFRKDLNDLLKQSNGVIAPEELAQAAIVAMARALGDDHTEFIPPAFWQRIRSGQTLGPGYNAVPVAGGSLVWEVLPGSDAERADLQPGDVILASQDPSNPGPDALNPNRPMSLTVQRGGTTIHFQLRGEPSPFQFIDWQRIDRNVGYIRIRSFLSNQDDFSRYAQAMAAGLQSIGFPSPDAWLIDLRNNGGGSSNMAAYVASRLGLTTAFAETVKRDGTSSVVSDHEESLTGQSPVVILVNQYTASAAEVFAAAFQGAGRAYVIGEKTRGAVNASDSFQVAGGALSITTGRILAGKDRVYLDRIGVTPDRLVPLTPESVMQAKVLGEERFLFSGQITRDPNRKGYDSQVQAALDYLRPLLER